MSPHMIAMLILAGGCTAVVVWVLHKIGKALVAVAEALATVAVVFVAVWWLLKCGVWTVRQVVRHWRTSLGLVAVLAWWHWLGWLSLAWTVGGLAVALVGWRLVDVGSFDRWAGRYLRAWWLRSTIYAPKLPGWLHACGLSIRDDLVPVAVTVNLVGRKKIRRDHQPAMVRYPAVLGVRSGPSWDEVRVRLVPGQKPEDFDEAARALASARQVARCQVREIEPHVVSIDFQRRNLLAGAVAGPDLAALATVAGAEVDLRRLWAGRTEYGQDWVVPLAGPTAQTLVVGASGSGKNSVMWSPLWSAAPAIRDGLVRMSGIDPKGMELAYGRGIFTDYAVTGADALELIRAMVGRMDARKNVFAGRTRMVPISVEHPLEVLEFDEIGALTKYTDRKTREAITELVAVLTTQGRALGYTVRGYVQEPTKDTVPVRELFARRICLRVTAKSHVLMALGDGAYERGAWANRIGESEAGVGFVWGEGIREPLRVRAGWVPDEAVKALETFVTGTVVRDAAVLPFPATPEDRTGLGGAA
jgi:S-DNA-T family DNA segregation ATPase FtsK/SpoIIIE